MDDAVDVGRRLREIRTWQGLSLKVVADFSGISFGYLAQLERGEKVIRNRQVLEALALTLRVSPTELIGKPWVPKDPVGVQGRTGLLAVEVALDAYDLGVDPGGESRPWPELAAEVKRMQGFLQDRSDYAACSEVLPGLLRELHGTYCRLPGRRRDVLIALVECYRIALFVTKRLGGRGLPSLAARLASLCIEEIDEPQWFGFGAYLRGQATGELDRPHQYRRSVAAADKLRPHLGQPPVAEIYGMLQLSAALAAAAQGDRDTCDVHLEEASAVAQRQEAEVGKFGRLFFGRTNVRIWKVAIAAEFREGGKVAEVARGTQPQVIPCVNRNAFFWADLGRSLVVERRTRDSGLTALLRAEKLAPQLVRNNVFVREAVAEQLRKSQQNSGGRELRGLAWRMGVVSAG